MRNFYLLIICFCIHQSIAAQQVDISKTTKDQLHIHTDKEYYLKGSKLFFKAYLSDQSGRLGTSKSEVVYVDLININGEIEETKTIKILEGIGTGTFDIGFKREDGKYLIRAYTNYMLNFDPRDFFRKVVFIENGKLNNSSSTSLPDLSQDVTLEIYPEGANFIQSLESSVLIYTKDGNGNPISANVNLIENDAKLSTHQTDKNGFAKFRLTPNEDAQYAISTINTKSNLLFSTNKTASIVTSQSENIIHLTVNSLSTLEGHSVKLIQGKTIIETVNLEDNTTQKIDYNLNDIPSGNLRLALFDKQNKISAERYIFNHLGIENFNVDFEFDAESYDKRSLVNLSIDVYDDEGESLPGNYSLSIVDRSFNKTSTNSRDIRTNMLLSSSTQLNSLKLDSLLLEDRDADIELIDNFMIMHGNSSKGIINSKTAQYEAEKDMYTNGKIHLKENPNDGVSASGEMYLLDSYLDVHSFHSNENGFFRIPTNITSDSIDVLFKVGEVKKNKKTNKVEVKANDNLDVTILDQARPPITKHSIELLKNSRPIEFQNPSKDIKQSLIHKADENTIYKYEDLLRSQDYDGVSVSLELDEVSIKADKLNDDINFYKKTMLYATPNSRIETKDIQSIPLYDDIYSLLRRLPSIQFEGPILGSGTKHTLILRGYSSGLASGGDPNALKKANAAKFMLNGAFVSQQAIEAIRPVDIAFIDVISSLSLLTQFGESGVNGVIAVYLKTVEQDQKPKLNFNSDLLPKSIKGYHVPNLFEYKNYSFEKDDKYDSRISIHWDPDLNISDSGSTTIEFYTADRYTIYDVILEGITDNGMPIQATSEILVSK
jgi:hypothetical protein